MRIVLTGKLFSEANLKVVALATVGLFVAVTLLASTIEIEKEGLKSDWRSIMRNVWPVLGIMGGAGGQRETRRTNARVTFVNTTVSAPCAP